MSWLELTIGFPLLVARAEPAIIYWSVFGVPVWQIFLCVVSWTSLTSILLWQTIGTGENLGKRIFQKIAGQNVNNATDCQGEKESRRRTIGWLLGQKNWIVLLFAFIPLIPWIPTAALISAKLLKIKRGLFVNLLGNFLRTLILILTLYYGVQLAI